MQYFDNNSNFKKNLFLKIYEIDNKSSQWPTGEHAHEYFQIWYVLEGQCVHYIENGSYLLKKNGFLAVPPNVVHSIGFAGDYCKVIGLDFSAEFISADSENVYAFAYIETFETAIRKSKEEFSFSSACQSIVEKKLLRMLEIYTKEEPYYGVELKSELLSLIVVIMRDYETRVDTDYTLNRYRDDIDRAIEYINNNYRERIYLSQGACVANMSVSYFSYFFREITGKSFISFVNDVRLEKAIELMADTKKSLSDVCEESGINDMSYFNRLFRKKFGISPGKYRKQFL